MKPLIKTLLAFFLIVFFLAGCSFLQVRQPVCDTAEPSVLCEAAARLNLSLDDVALGLKLGNITGLSTDAYSAQAAFDFIAECKTFTQTHGSLTYGDFVSEVMARYMKLSPTVQALFVLASADFSLSIAALEEAPLTDYDYYLILLHLDKQQALVVPFLLAS